IGQPFRYFSDILFPDTRYSAALVESQRTAASALHRSKTKEPDYEAILTHVPRPVRGSPGNPRPERNYPGSRSAVRKGGKEKQMGKRRYRGRHVNPGEQQKLPGYRSS